MTDSLKEKIEEVLKNEEVTQKILYDDNYGRRSLAKEYDFSKYYCQKVIDEIKENPNVDVENKKVITDSSAKNDGSQPSEEDVKERANEPIDASDWEIPDEWVYDKNYVYNNDDDKYVFSTREFGNIVLSGSKVKNMVKAYSNWDGDADTINEVCRRFGITRGLFQEIKSILGLTHDHEPFTPDEIRDKSPEEMAQEAYQMKRFRTKQEFDKLDWKETQKEAKKWRNLKQSILTEVKTDAPSIIVDPIEPESTALDNVEDIVVFTGDWHIGALAVGLPNIPDFNTKILKEYINTMVKAIRHDFPNARVHIKYTGDTIETVTGMNHADSWKNIEQGFYGAKPILKAEEFLFHFIKSIRAVSFDGVTGNHGRITSERRKDHSGEAEIIVYQHLKDRLEDVDVNYSEFQVADVIQGIGYLMYHGHKKVSKDAKQNVIRAIQRHFNEEPEFTLVAQGHYHHRQVNDDTTIFRHITVPSLFTGHDYNERNGFGALAGFDVAYRHPITQAVQLENYSL